MKNPAQIIKYGTDSSGRAIYMTRYMAKWWKRVIKLCGFKPTIVQGAFMAKAGGGAADSEGYHDGAGCLDLRTWDLTAAQVQKLIHVLREMGAGAWVRDERHGMDPHIHLVLGSDLGLTPEAAQQWLDYLNGLDGLAGKRADYHWRPSPIVRKPVFPQKGAINAALKASKAAAEKLGYDGIVKRLDAIRSDVKAK